MRTQVNMRVQLMVIEASLCTPFILRGASARSIPNRGYETIIEKDANTEVLRLSFRLYIRSLYGAYRGCCR
jgi:hypothetical protein